MNSETLFRDVFGSELSQEGTIGYLEELQAKFPWFALPHFYKLKNTGIGHKDYNKQAALTAQFFPNIYILNQRIQQKNFSTQYETAGIVPAHQEHESDQPQPVVEPVTENIPVIKETEKIIPEVQEQEAEEPQPLVEPVTENLSIIKEAAIMKPEEEHLKKEQPKFTVDRDSEDTSAEQELEIKEANKFSASESILEKAAADFKKEIPNNSSKGPEAMLFEPLHATDYFASQGIKLSEEQQSKDKLGMQMKSFTSWLKVMKKTPEQQQGLQQVADEAQIQNLANKSNTEAEVITESMADVYLQQNKKEKAREIYKKLSLINPDKSAYFAAKIENLNEK